MVCSQLHFQTRLAPFILTEIVKTCTPSKYGTLIKRPWEFKGSIFRARRKAEKLSGQNLCALFFPTARKCKTERDSVFNAFLLALSLAALFYALELRRLARRKSREKMSWLIGEIKCDADEKMSERESTPCLTPPWIIVLYVTLGGAITFSWA